MLCEKVLFSEIADELVHPSFHTGCPCTAAIVEYVVFFFWGGGLPLHILQCQCEGLASGHFAEAGLCALAVPGSVAPASSTSHHPSAAGMNVSGKMGPHSVWCDVFAFSEELAGWKLGFGWRGPLNLALAEGNNKVTDFISLYAVCMASYALYTTRPKSWCPFGTVKE